MRAHTKLYGTNTHGKLCTTRCRCPAAPDILKRSRTRNGCGIFVLPFEGTTEIHSIYPSLALARNFSKMMMSKRGVKRILFLLAARLKRGHWNMRSDIPEVQCALHDAKRYARRFRRLFLTGLLLHGKDSPKKNFCSGGSPLSVFLCSVCSHSRRKPKQ